MMKERFAKLLLGEDMSGGGKGVCTAVTISNAITNLYGNLILLCSERSITILFFFKFIAIEHVWILNSAATVFGQNLKLEPLKPEKKAMWKREMKVLLSVCDYIQEFAPTAQYLEDGTIVEVSFSK